MDCSESAWYSDCLMHCWCWRLKKKQNGWLVMSGRFIKNKNQFNIPQHLQYRRRASRSAARRGDAGARAASPVVCNPSPELEHHHHYGPHQFLFIILEYLTLIFVQFGTQLRKVHANLLKIARFVQNRDVDSLQVFPSCIYREWHFLYRAPIAKFCVPSVAIFGQT